MITARTTTGSSWEHFMRLTAQARERNNGLTASSVKTGNSRIATVPGSTSVKKSNAAATGMTTTALPIQRGTYQGGSVDVSPGKIIGGKFDAWA